STPPRDQAGSTVTRNAVFNFRSRRTESSDIFLLFLTNPEAIRRVTSGLKPAFPGRSTSCAMVSVDIPPTAARVASLLPCHVRWTYHQVLFSQWRHRAFQNQSSFTPQRS